MNTNMGFTTTTTAYGVEEAAEARQKVSRNSSNKRRSTPLLLQQRVASTLTTAACIACLILSNTTPQAMAFTTTAPLSRSWLASAPQASYCGVGRRRAGVDSQQQRHGRRRLRHRPAVSSTTCMAYYGGESDGKDGPPVDPFDEAKMATSHGQHVINWYVLVLEFLMILQHGHRVVYGVYLEHKTGYVALMFHGTTVVYSR